ncbi:MAG: hypothetical protein FJ387_26590, partial [Verrucomicrobia bacterium]|nr:hypothetical protein [Verrucomicrobiota bacterium]
ARERTIDNATTVTWTSAHRLSLGGGTVWNNLGGSTLDLQTDAVIDYWFGAGGTFNNAGILRKSAGTATFTFDYTLNNTGTVRIETGRMAFRRGFQQTAGAFELVGGHADGPSHFLIGGGRIEGAGELNSAVGLGNATALPGNPLGRLRIGGTFTNATTTRLTFQLGGTNPGTNYDQIAATGGLVINGELTVEFANDFEPSGADAFILLTGATRTGTFNATNAPPGFSPEVTYTPTNVTLRLVKTGVVPPAITRHPQNLEVTDGQPATFSVLATGPNLTYQWRKNGVDIPGATAAEYSFLAADFPDAGTYSVRVANAGGSQTSIPAILTVNPSSLEAGLLARYALDDNLTDAIGVHHGAGTGNLLFLDGARDRAVRLDGSSWIALGINPALPIVQPDQAFSATFWIRPRARQAMVPVRLATPAGEFAVYLGAGPGTLGTHIGFRDHVAPLTTDPRATVENALGCWTHVTAVYLGGDKDSRDSLLLYLNGEPVPLDSAVSMTGGTGRNELGRNIGGSGGYVVGDLDEVRLYRRALRPGDALALAVNRPVCPPEIVTQPPTTLAVPLGAGFTLEVTAWGAPPLAYQWYKNGNPIPGASNARYLDSGATLDDAGTYAVTVTNPHGSARSTDSQLSIDLPQPSGLATLTLGLPNFISSASFLNANFGAVGFRGLGGAGAGGGVLWTVNGGQTWSRSNIGVTNNVYALQLVDSVAYLAGTGGLLCISTNNGASWVTFPTGTTENFHGLAFYNSQRGFAVGTRGTICIYDGRTWIPQTTGTTADFYAVTTIGTTAWAVGSAGTISQYLGGQWVPVDTGTAASFYAVAFLRPDLGYAVGSGGTICRYNGSRWIALESGTTGTFRAVAIVDETTAYAAGDNGLFCVTRDGGITWEPLTTGTSTALATLTVTSGRAFLFGAGGAGFTFAVPGQVLNLPPLIAIVEPTNNQTFYACQDIVVAALATDPDGAIAKVEFFRGQFKLSEIATPPRPGRPYRTGFSTDVFGTYELRATATDNRGAVTVSDPVTIEVIPPPLHTAVADSYSTNGFAICFRGIPGRHYVLEAAPDLAPPIQWLNLSTNLMPELLLHVLDPQAAESPRRFYRFRLVE